MNQFIANLKEQRDEFIAVNNSSFNVLDQLKNKTVPELKKITEEQQFSFWVMCLNVLGDLNIGTVIRSSHLFGAEKVVIFGRRRIDNRGLVGAANYTDVEKVWGVKEDSDEIDAELFQNFCSTNRVFPVFVEQGGDNVYDFDWESLMRGCVLFGMKPMIVLGTENSGIPQNILDLEIPSSVVSIPQRGCIRSFNVSAAFSIVMSQMVGKLGWY
jgi:tRNA G18 (ribose-2'-O)-methylase SpoU